MTAERRLLRSQFRMDKPFLYMIPRAEVVEFVHIHDNTFPIFVQENLSGINPSVHRGTGSKVQKRGETEQKITFTDVVFAFKIV